MTADPGPPGGGALPAAPPAELYYRLQRPAAGHMPGHHRSHRGHGGLEFRGHASLLDAPDPRRLDLHASLRDPAHQAGHWRVRVYSQPLSVPVWVLADLSASMGYAGRHRKLDVMADFVESLAWSAWRTGDAFGFVGCDETVRPDWLLPASRARGLGGPLAARLRRLQPRGRSAHGLLEAGRLLARRALVFVVSDFHLPLDAVGRLLDGLAAHEVVPVLLWDAQESDLGERRGLATLRDPETGTERLVWWRPALRERWRAARQARREALQACFRARRLDALVLERGFDAEAVTRHFHG